MAHSSNPGNFANDREKASAAGHKGAQSSGHQTDAKHDTKDIKHDTKHGSGNFADDREKAAEAGRKGGSR